MNASIDFASIRATVDLEALITAAIGPPLRGRRWACPFHNGEAPNLSIASDGRSWRCWKCGAHGDVLDFVARLEGVTVAEAARRLGGLDAPQASRGPRPTPRPSEPPAPRQAPAWTDPEWQEAVDAIVLGAEALLWGPAGRDALDWLRARGLADHAIRRFRLGFNPEAFNTPGIEVLGRDHEGRPRSIWVRRGITIPWAAPGSGYGRHDGPRWAGCNVRRLAAGDVSAQLPDRPKYLALAGSTRGHAYPWADVAPGLPALITEGEFDALLAWQETGHIANVLTIGGAGQTPQADALEALAACPDWLLLLDHDAAGDEAARKLAGLGRHKARRLLLPGAKDLTDFVVAGGDVLAWLADEWTRFGWPWPDN